jgi:hypothetical protein
LPPSEVRKYATGCPTEQSHPISEEGPGLGAEPPATHSLIEAPEPPASNKLIRSARA